MPRLTGKHRRASAANPLRLTAQQFAERIGCGLYPGPGDAITQTELADALQLSERAVRNLHERGLPHTGDRGELRYPSAACRRWYIVYKRRVADGQHVRHLEPADADRQYALMEFEQWPDGYDVVMRPILEALKEAVIEIDPRVLKRFARLRIEPPDEVPDE